MDNKKNIDINKKNASLIISNSSEEKSNNEEKIIKKSKTKKLSIENLDEEESKLEFEEQVTTIKNIKKIVDIGISTFLKNCIGIIEKVNIKIFGSLKKKKEEEIIQVEEEIKEEEVKEEPFSFKIFLDMNIIFTDNKKKPLYSQPKQKNSMYEHNYEILNESIISKIKDILIDTADKLRKVPIPDKGQYKDIPLDIVMRNITDDEIYNFLSYVRQFPSKYIAKNYRISESFAAWVMSGTPED